MSRIYSDLANEAICTLLEILADKQTNPSLYQETIVRLGNSLSDAVLDEINGDRPSIYLASTVEDADFLAKGMLERLEGQAGAIAFACFWNQRFSPFEVKDLAVAPITKKYQEPANKVDYLIVAQSLISTTCIARTNLVHLLQRMHPQRILITAPVIYYEAEQKLRDALEDEIANKLQFVYFAEDDEYSAEGEVIPGIGGYIFERLGFSEQFSKNEYVPELVKQRRSRFTSQRKASTPSTSSSASSAESLGNPLPLDIFALRDQIIDDYRRYIESFLKIRDPKVRTFVDQALEEGRLWTEPLLQVNPTYRRGATVDELVQQGILHPDNTNYFPNNGKPFQFHYHQQQAFLAAQHNEPYVLTTGTGSGKSMTYVVPIFDDLLRHPEIKGVRAILVYPMNALVNSQADALKKLLERVPNSHIRFEKYTGQEPLQKKTEIQNNPPQILLTNYVMLELMLSRTDEDKLVSSKDLKFLVLDELHTYRGRQGADVSILIRKLRQRCGRDFLCIGTSATMSTGGTREHRRQVVADIASKVFGVGIQPTRVIDETLERATRINLASLNGHLRESVLQGLPSAQEQTLQTFKEHPLSAWIEMNFGLAERNGDLVRHTPIPLRAGAETLAAETHLPPETCEDILKQMLLWGNKTKGLAFRLHQFISQGGSVYTTLENRDRRDLTLEGQYTTTENRLLFPLVFCRECGHDYYVVRYDADHHTIQPVLPTSLDIAPEDADIRDGYLTLNEPGLWTENDEDRLPDSWFTETKKRGRVPKKDYVRFIPQRLQVMPNGQITDSLLEGVSCWFVPKPFMTCLNCGVVHDGRRNEFSKLSRLSSEGRSTATTLLCLSSVSRLRSNPSTDREAAKILSFTDNRQDASLQAGHFNDFVQTSFLRASLNKALQANRELTHSQLAREVVKQMGLTQETYAKETAEFGGGKRRNEESFLKLVTYRLYEDLRRGWRIVQPNLEQCGLLAIEYDELHEICSNDAVWQKHAHPLLLQATPEQREMVARTFLNHLRRELAIDAEWLQPEKREQLKQDVRQAIKEPWAFEEHEKLHEAAWATVVSGTTSSDEGTRSKVKLTARSKIGRFLRSPKAWPWRSELLSDSEYSTLLITLINALADCGFLLVEGKEVQLRVDSMIWRATKVNEIPPDPLTSRRLQGSEETAIPVNQFFQTFYESTASQIETMEGREHTGQVSNEDRVDRESRFKDGELAALFCSPTMELGIDISDLSVVHMRNVPPSPANYAQRSGRAGRSGQQALVLTYASMGSGHDQYFFKRQDQMVSGAVVPPELELGNRDLIQSHIYSIWLAYTGQDLQDSMNKLLDLELEGCPLKETVRQQLTLSSERLDDCLGATQAILEDTFCRSDLEHSSWYSVNWLRDTLDNALNSFDRACDRWRDLYSDAVNQRDTAQITINRSATGRITDEERKIAESQEREARRQIDLLVGRTSKNKSTTEFEFYPYRYFAAEGFLPGYNFPRLPVRAYLPAGEQGEFISRPRSVALREFAPGNIVYYEGSKFKIAKTRIPIGGIESEYKRVSVCFNCGYFHEGNFRDTCENCGSTISSGYSRNAAKLNHVLPMGTMITWRQERITCDEEERLKYGYNITTHFRYAPQKKESAIVEAEDGTKLLRLKYGDAATIWRINRGLKKNTQEQGFKLNIRTGQWGDLQDEQPNENLHTEVFLMVEDTTNILIVEPLIPPQVNREEFITTLQYALEASIRAIYKLEEDELDSERLGDGKYLLFWEASEGGAGVLSQILGDSEAFQKIADTALDICHFKEEKDSCVQACYECLLSYRNQFDHPLINRHLIQPHLNQLLNSTLSRHADGVSREEQYQTLRSQTDPDSELERDILDEIYRQGLKLPDAAQELIPEANSKPDFIYKAARIAVFCDGPVHDHPDQSEQDRVERDNLRYDANYTVLVLRYDEDWQAKLKILASRVG